MAGEILIASALVGASVMSAAAFGIGVRLISRGAYRWARSATSSSVVAVGAGALGGLIGLIGGWVIADLRAAWRARGRMLWLLAVGAWAVAALVTEAVAVTVGNSPQPEPGVWVAILVWSPSFPLALAVGVGGALSLKGRQPAWDSAGVARALLWSSVALGYLVVPKP